MITWTNCRVKLGALKPWAQNPRYSTKAQARRILQSLADFGQVQTVAIGPEAEVYDGHQRLSALLTLHGADYELDARQASRPLSDGERRALVVALHAGALGAWDWDALAAWDPAELRAGGMDAELKQQWDVDALNLRELLTAQSAEEDRGEACLREMEIQLTPRRLFHALVSIRLDEAIEIKQLIQACEAKGATVLYAAN